MKKISLVLAIALLLFSCNLKEKATQEASSQSIAQNVTDNSQNALDWQGMYTGVLPCADCEGIRTTLALQEGKYTLKSVYLGKEASSFHSQGEFKWSEDGSSITLLGDNAIRYKVGENKLFQLDLDGNLITGALKDHYVLIKVNSPILDITWVLMELNGQIVENTDKKPITLMFNTSIGSAIGFAGCNGYGGEFELKEEKLQIWEIFSTEMACPQLTIEGEYLKGLRRVDNFTLEADVLVLKDGSTVLAKLVKED